MKYIFSLFTILSLQVNASLVHIIFEEKNSDGAQIVRSIFHEQYDLPLEFIEMHMEMNCDKKFRKGMNLCLGDKQSLSLISNINDELIKKSILSFTEQRGVKDVY